MSDSMEDRIKALEDALTLAANRLQRIALDFDTGSRRFFEVVEWVESAHATLAASQPAQPVAVEDAATQAVQRAIDRLRSLHPSAGRPAWDEIVAEEMAGALRALTVQDAARMVADAINNDMQTFNKALGSIPVRLEMPVQHFFSMALKAYAEELYTLKEQEQ